jgi:hypothetical protein
MPHSVSYSSSSGGVLLDVPIRTSPATAGYAPSLSLSFSSSSASASNLVGAGFHIKGVTHISHCPVNLETDGETGSLDFFSNESSKYCLAGERLVNVSGAYGQPGTAYAMEIDSFTRVHSWGAVDGAPAYWEAKSHSGERIFFGNTTDSVLHVPGRQQIAQWGMSKKQDIHENYMEIVYSDPGVTSAGSLAISSVLYGGSKALSDPTHAIEFHYEDRPDLQNSFAGGLEMEHKQRLASVHSVWSDDKTDPSIAFEILIKYELGCVTSESRVVSLQECSHLSGSSPICKPPVELKWDQACTSNEVTFKPTNSSNNPWPEHFIVNGIQHDISTGDLQFSDFDGDETATLP